jgi:hypothetical protein
MEGASYWSWLHRFLRKSGHPIGPDIKTMQGKPGQLPRMALEMIFQRARYQGGIVERKEMIDRYLPLPISQQTGIIVISRGKGYSLPGPLSDGALNPMPRVDQRHREFPLAVRACCVGCYDRTVVRSAVSIWRPW